MDLELIASIVSIALAAGTSLVYATLGEIVTERSGILNLGVEGIMIMGAVTGFAAAFHTDSVWGGVNVHQNCFHFPLNVSTIALMLIYTHFR